MALILQNDEGGVAGANAYVSVDDFKAYHTDRGNNYAAYTDPELAAGIVRATDYIDRRYRKQFLGTKLSAEQSTQWPREDATDRDGNTYEGIPMELKVATQEYALRALSSALLADTVATGNPAIQSESFSVEGLSQSVSYFDSILMMPSYPMADYVLEVLLKFAPGE